MVYPGNKIIGSHKNDLHSVYYVECLRIFRPSKCPQNVKKCRKVTERHAENYPIQITRVEIKIPKLTITISA